MSKVARAWPGETPSRAANRAAAFGWPVSFHTPEASIRGANRAFPARTSRSIPARRS